MSRGGLEDHLAGDQVFQHLGADARGVELALLGRNVAQTLADHAFPLFGFGLEGGVRDGHVVDRRRRAAHRVTARVVAHVEPDEHHDDGQEDQGADNFLEGPLALKTKAVAEFCDHARFSP